ncbi:MULTISPECIES: hypothetical protein [Bacillus cereus group]|uniref:Uncharacterized protein n=1 Tax=Bacillus cereus TaxID=1396 RepID=A0A9X7QMT7_BACCE|nr:MULTISPECIES: hypothetical protein [Bacillus cereus group]MCQ6288117.1 hypothetical protein [Bacillus cereus]MCQ6316534.1 hypothetical protein [Bacillus cereus]MCQ6327667.1 hypothetical protein [Bacillus cereus]MCQ6385145.1 hypothetical protein [Bacillus cereus]MDM8365873.1 hypothetical protein [Bacillus thuringiensis]
MLRSIFKSLIYIAGICFVGSFILSAFPETQGVWEFAKQQFSVFYNLGVAQFGMIGTLIIFASLVFLLQGKR